MVRKSEEAIGGRRGRYASSKLTPSIAVACWLQRRRRRFTFDSPSAKNVPVPLPKPAEAGSPTALTSLFLSRNLARIVEALDTRFASNQLILSLAIYPGELEAEVGADGQAQTVTATPSGQLQVGALQSFSGTLNGIALRQLEPAVPQRLAREIAGKGATSRLSGSVPSSCPTASWAGISRPPGRHDSGASAGRRPEEAPGRELGLAGLTAPRCRRGRPRRREPRRLRDLEVGSPRLARRRWFRSRIPREQSER